MTLLMTEGFDRIENTATTDSVAVQEKFHHSLGASGTIDFRTDFTPIGRGKSCRFTDEKQSVIFDLNTVGSVSLPSGLVGFHFHHSDPAQDYRVLAGMYVVIAGTEAYQWSLWVSKNGSLSVHRDLGGNELFSTDDHLIQPNGWYYIEVQYYTADSIPTNTFIVRVDGREVINLPVGTDTKAQTFANTRYIKWQGGTSVNTYIDDIYICSLTGARNKSFLGPCYVQTVEPTGDFTTNFTGTDGDEDDNYLNVDEVIIDEDTTTNQHVSSSNGLDLYHMRHLQGSIGSIFGVELYSRAKTNDLSIATTWANIINVSGSNNAKPSVILTTNYEFYNDIFETNPQDGQDWNQGNLEAVSCGVNIQA